jgi:ABC-type branched-subunit amino acid transport system substrate-binding protein
MVNNKVKLLAVAAVALMVAAGCSSSKKASSSSTTASSGSSTTANNGTTATTAQSSPGGGGSSSGKTITVGVLTDLTGPGANISSTFPQGIKAGIGLAAAQDGIHIKYVVADTTTSPTGVLTAAQRLVSEDHVYAVIASSVLFFAAAKYLAQHNIPVFGPGADGDEWITTPNLFSIIGYQDYTKVYTMFGDFYKAHGVTNLGVVAYGIEPSSKESAEDVAASAKHAGINVGYQNYQFPLGSTNVEPVALAMKSAGINGLNTSIVTNSNLAIVTALNQQGIHPVNVLATGYGGDLIQGGAGASVQAQDSYFITGAEPVELNTPATQQFQNALKTYAGVTGDPTFSEYNGYLAIAALDAGLKAGGANQTQAQLIQSMLGLKNFNGDGLWGGHTLSFAMADRGTMASVDNCIWFEHYTGGQFVPVKNFSPVCGQLVPGATVPK